MKKIVSGIVAALMVAMLGIFAVPDTASAHHGERHDNTKRAYSTESSPCQK